MGWRTNAEKALSLWQERKIVLYTENKYVSDIQ